MKRTLGIVLIILMVIIPLAGCLASDTGSSEEDDVLIVAMELAYPPFETKDENGEPTGISVDFANAFGEYIGQEVVIENIAWEGLIPALETGKVDMIISSMTITDEREETVDFSDPYANSLLGILANIDSGIETAEDLNQEGMIIAVKTGSTGFIYAQNSLENAEILSLADESACVAEVTSGKADVFIYDQLTIYRNWQNNLETTEAIFIPFQDVEYWGVAVQEGNTELVTKMNEFIQVYTEEGGFDELTEKYLSEEKEKFDELGFQWFFDLQ